MDRAVPAGRDDLREPLFGRACRQFNGVPGVRGGPQLDSASERLAELLKQSFRPSATGRRVVDHTRGVIPASEDSAVVTIRPMVEEDIPAALALWQGLPGIGLRAADSPPALARYLAAQPGHAASWRIADAANSSA